MSLGGMSLGGIPWWYPLVVSLGGILAELSVHPKTARRILRKMAERGLVRVESRRGRSPLVTIVSPEPAEAMGPIATTDEATEGNTPCRCQ
ncbi:hypothetical protein Q31b_07240 [Novipirellula aureliae]|uniref:Uncharacterized protein n=1 Tax=Novipirellula aureliae TaxID=2527966 RepID=A0A5C6EA00_9BACT|nr:hypothetical protein Q31b_07240 [Novipirellula aureliae]